MAAPAQQGKYSAQEIGQAFVEQYYAILHQNHAIVYRFYKDVSKLGRPEDSGIMSWATGMDAINEKIQSYGTLKAEITSVDAQESYNEGVVVLVTGHMVKEDGRRWRFTQTFFLAPQKEGYFVLNDIVRYEEQGHSQQEYENLANGVAALNVSDQEASPVHHNEIADLPEEVNGGEVYDPLVDGEGSVVEQEEPEPEIMNEISVESEELVASDIKTKEAPTKTYASILKVASESVAPMSASSSLKSISKNQHQQVSTITPTASAAEKTNVSSKVSVDGNNQLEEGEGFSIYIKNLPINVTYAMIEEAFKKFGPIKIDGIQVRHNKAFGPFGFGFVEFEVPEAAQNAIEAVSVVMGGRQVGIEEKKSTYSRVSSRGWFPEGRGGFRSEGLRGRIGSYGRGRGYGRGDYGRGGFQNRYNGEYQRSDIMSNGGGASVKCGGHYP